MDHGDELVRQPGLIDLQVNGYAGWDVNSDDVTTDTLVELTRCLWQQGVTSYFPTVITASEEKILHCLSVIADARRTDSLVAHSIAGIHVEGPSLAAEDGPRGAHEARHLRDPDVNELHRWQKASGGLVRLVTLAPERPGATEYIRRAVAHGIRISIGHCAPTSEQVHAAAADGATLSTHLGNGAHLTLPRHPNHIWAQLADDRLTAMLIADGHHLPADTLTAMIKAKSSERCVLTSDAAALAGMPPGEYRTPVGGSVTVGEDGRLHLTGTKLLAGAGRSLRECLDWAVRSLPFSAQTLLELATTNPARVIGEEWRVTTGQDIALVDGHELAAVQVCGVEVYRR